MTGIMTDAAAFELYLASLMRAQPPPGPNLEVERVRGAVGFLEGRAHPLQAYLQILGQPSETSPEPSAAGSDAFRGSLCHRFALRRWPAFDLLLRSHPTGWVWGPEFLRRRGEPAPTPVELAQLTPWSVLESEVLARFGPFHEETAWNLQKTATYLVHSPHGPQRIELAFDLSLLQTVTVFNGL
jgi:hypothetical protein